MSYRLKLVGLIIMVLLWLFGSHIIDRMKQR